MPHSFKMENPGEVITVSILEMPVVLLPTQLLPFHTDYPLLVSQLQHAARENEYIALKPRLDNFETNIATLIQVLIWSLRMKRVLRLSKVNHG